MNRIFTIASIAALAILLLAVSVQAGTAPVPLYQATPNTPSTISYQGRILVNGARFNGAGLFKFTVVNSAGDAAYWSNDGTGLGAAPFQPTDHITLTVNNGIFGIAFGDTSIAGMTQPITAGIATSPDRSLRVWFNDGALGWQQLAPDVTLSSVPYAFVADSSASATTATTATSSHNADLLGGLAASSSPTTTAIVSTDVTGAVALSKIYGGVAANDDLTLEGTSHATKTTSYVILQPVSGKVVIGGVTASQKLEVNYGNLRFNQESLAITPPTTAIGTGTGLTGTYQYRVTFITADGETEAGNISTPAIVVSNQGISLTNIPLGSSACVARKIYRNTNGGSVVVMKLVDTINDNTTTTYTDIKPDASLGATISYINTTGGTIYNGTTPLIVSNIWQTRLGFQAGPVATGVYNTMFGSYPGQSITTGGYGTYIGYGAGQNVANTDHNVAVGYTTLGYMAGGSYDTAVGNSSGRYCAGLGNVLLGYQAGRGTASYSGNYNTIIGYAAGYNVSGGSNVFIGNQAGYNETGSNKLYIANSNTATPLIGGDFSASTLSLNGNVNIGGNVVPTTNTFNLGSSSLWWNEIHYHTLTSHSLSDFANGVKLRDGRTVGCLDALAELKPDKEKTTNGHSHIDYSTLPLAAYHPAKDSIVIHTFTTTNKSLTNGAVPISYRTDSDNDDPGAYYIYTTTETLKGEPGADLDAMVSLVLCAANEVNAKSATLEARIAALEKALGVKTP